MGFKNIITISLLIISLVIITACSEEESPQPLSIGLVTPLTGDLASLGETVERAATLAVGEINAAGGNVELIVEDSKGNVQAAVIATQKLINVNKVPLILEAATSGEAAAIAPVAQQNGVIHYSILATTESLVDAGEYVFKMREGAVPHVSAIIQSMKKEKVSSVDVLYLSDEYCTNMITLFKQRARQEGLTVGVVEQYQSNAASDVRTQLTKIKVSSSRGIYVCGFYKELGLVFKQIEEFDLKKKLFSVTTFEHPLVVKMAGKEALESTIYSVSPLDCSQSQFCEKYKARYGQEPDYRAAFTYDAVYMVANAARDSHDAALIKDRLLSTQYSGATGVTSFDAKGNAMKEVVVHQVKGGEWVEYK